MNRSSRYSALSIALFALAGCAHIPKSSVGSSICNQDAVVGTQFSKLAITVFPDQHGDSAKADVCPDRGFAIDWSKSGLFDEQYQDLLMQLRRSALRGGQAVSVVVSGNIQLKDQDGYPRPVLGITDIVKYSIDD